MKNLHKSFFLFFCIGLIAASFYFQYQSRAQRKLDAEVKELEVPVLAAYESISEVRKLYLEAKKDPQNKEKIHETAQLIKQHEQKLKSDVEQAQKKLQEPHSLLARLTVIPKLAPILSLMNRQEEAKGLLSQGMNDLEKVEFPEIRAACCICFAESALNCLEFQLYESFLEKSKEIIGKLCDGKRKDEMNKTLENLQLLEKEVRKKTAVTSNSAPESVPATEKPMPEPATEGSGPEEDSITLEVPANPIP